jgi:hypothetical protein
MLASMAIPPGSGTTVSSAIAADALSLTLKSLTGCVLSQAVVLMIGPGRLFPWACAISPLAWA